MSEPWIVLKYGGTSVASKATWAHIASHARALSATHRVWIVISALSGVTNLLLAALDEALAGVDPEAGTAFPSIVSKHERLAGELGLSGAPLEELRTCIHELGVLLKGVAFVREASPSLRARVLSFGELASTWIGLGALKNADLDAVRVDARRLLRSEMPVGTPEETVYLEAHVAPRTDVEAAEKAADGHRVVLTQGFIASTAAGRTVLLGRGGSDTSGALFAALVKAERCEIWTDVHGMFTTDPRQLPSARLLTRVRYREAQELAAMGAKVLHPRSLEPVRWAGIPLHIRNTMDPNAQGTLIGPEADDEPAVMAIAHRTGVPLVTVSTLAMWGVPGFLAAVFARFAEFGMSIDLVATSQSAVTVTLDHVPGGLQGEAFGRLTTALDTLGKVTVEPNTGVVSMVGRHIRTVLHELGESFAAFEQRKVHLVSASSEDLNLSFVVAADDAPKLVRELHAKLLGAGHTAPWLGPSFSDLTGAGAAATPMPHRWWMEKRAELIEAVADGEARYVLDIHTVRARAEAITQKLTRVSGRFYAMKANAHPAVLEAVAAAGFGIETVSIGEVEHVRNVLGPNVPIQFTPNFCPVVEYAQAYALGADVVVDGPEVLRQAPTFFAKRPLGLRIDPGVGHGHHKKVRTAGSGQKFGLPLDDLPAFLEAVKAVGARVEGLHAHVGSGILSPEPWAEVGRVLVSLRPHFPHLRWVDVGGGLGVVEKPGQAPLDLDALNTLLGTIEGLEGLELRIEPGRYLVSEAGVLVMPVTQVRTKGGVTFVGAAAGMNALIRPALYGAWHGIHNLTRFGEPHGVPVEVVGPICETGDVLGHDRMLPTTQPGDVLLVENTGAYGSVMASLYNLREVPEEVAWT